MDPMACEAARENLFSNGVEDRVEIREGEVGEGKPLPEEPFEGIVANMQRVILIPLLPSFHDSLLPGGWLILSGLLAQERAEVVSRAGDVGLDLEEEDAEEEWWTGAFRRRRPEV
jgi:ribosomal protein L11 methyltransferase